MPLPKLISEKAFKGILFAALVASLGVVIYWAVRFSGPYRFFAEKMTESDGTYLVVPVFLLAYLSAFLPVMGLVILLRPFANMKPVPKETGSFGELFSKNLSKHFPASVSQVPPGTSYPAGLRSKRIFAFLIDRALVILAFLVMIPPFVFLHEYWPNLDMLKWALIPGVVAVVFYAWARDFRRGQSVARRWLKLRVVDVETGEPIGAWRSFKRETLLHFAPLILIEILYLCTRPDGRRLGDFWAKTRVEAVES